MTKAMNNHWVPVTYGIALTTLVFAFDLGMIWNLNPYEFPKWFCVGQMFVINISVFVLVGVCTSYYIATLVTVLLPQYRDASRGPGLAWHPAYFVLLVGLPTVSTTLQMYFTLTLGADRQIGFDTTICDVTEPLWPKLLGYGGLPLLFTFPCSLFMFVAVRRLSRMLDMHKTIWVHVADNVRFELRMRRRRRAEAARTEARKVVPSRKNVPDTMGRLPTYTSTTHTHTRHSMEKGDVPLVRLPTSPISTHSPRSTNSTNPTTPFAIVTFPPSPSRSRASLSHDNEIKTVADTSFTRALHPSFMSSTEPLGLKLKPSFTSTAPSTFTPEVHEEKPRICIAPVEEREYSDIDKYSPVLPESDLADCKSAYRSDSPVPSGGHVPLPATGSEGVDIDPSKYRPGYGPDSDLYDDADVTMYMPPPQSSVVGKIWRLILFQGAFFVIASLLAISTLYSLITHGPPREFGSDHVAGIITSWAPVIVFGHSPGVLKHLTFWRKQPTFSSL
ncbi:hypothetical protein FIBSPDRAFT_861831 [Athelia psychrophila]|uniref:Uncharacterized protein n=1 Tax=Athelia psychrophila TaxID=1759441 RepID=A0A166IYL2_9AGAM|nr:hypothetical protein FIBSPDRAFT_861831 [Fibularhizoctonia sp. CBS 109695]